MSAARLENEIIISYLPAARVSSLVNNGYESCALLENLVKRLVLQSTGQIECNRDFKKILASTHRSTEIELIKQKLADSKEGYFFVSPTQYQDLPSSLLVREKGNVIEVIDIDVSSKSFKEDERAVILNALTTQLISQAKSKKCKIVCSLSLEYEAFFYTKGFKVMGKPNVVVPPIKSLELKMELLIEKIKEENKVEQKDSKKSISNVDPDYIPVAFHF